MTMDEDCLMENRNGKGVRNGTTFPYQLCTHLRERVAMTLKGFLKLSLDAPKRQEERRLLGKLNQDHSSHKKNSNFQPKMYSILKRCDLHEVKVLFYTLRAMHSKPLRRM